MQALEFLAGVVAVLALGAALATQLLSRNVERRFPPLGEFAETDGIRLHYFDIPAGPSADLAPMVFVHGASGNARDLMGAFGDRLKGRGRMIFVDRPGAGYSGRTGGNDAAPDLQAGYVAALLDRLAIGKAVIVGHSLGGAITAAFAVQHPEKTAGLVFIAPATHPWPEAQISWYYKLANLPVLGALFAHTVAVPFGNLKYRSVVREVFAPDRVPNSYSHRSATRLVLRPANFLHNARDVGDLHANVERLSLRYGEIRAPTVIITGDRDNTVLADIHSVGLQRDIEGARLVWLENTGHMPTYSATDQIIAEIERLNADIRSKPASGPLPRRGEPQIPDRPSLAT